MPGRPMRFLETRIPPPLVMLLCGLLGLGISLWLPATELPTPWWAAVAVVAAGLVMNLLPKLAFQHAGTTVNPMRPASSTVLITAGVYRYTRNPMYLGQAAFLLGGMLYLQNLLALAVVPMFVLYITRFHPSGRACSRRAFRRPVHRVPAAGPALVVAPGPALQLIIGPVTDGSGRSLRPNSPRSRQRRRHAGCDGRRSA